MRGLDLGDVNDQENACGTGPDAQPVVRWTPRAFSQFALHDGPDASDEVAFEHWFRVLL